VACLRTAPAGVRRVALEVCHQLVAGRRLGLPGAEEDVLDKLESARLLTADAVARLRRMQGCRNILGHENGHVLRDLARERGDIEALEAPLEGYCRLRVGGYRVVFAYGKRPTIECIFAEQRSVVYEMLLERLRDRLRGEGE